MLEKVLAVSTLSAAVILLALLQVTSPASIHPLGILFVFVLLYVLVLGLLTLFIFSGSIMLRSLRVIHEHLSLKTAYFYASVLALAPIIIICMRSIGQVDVYEILLVLVFEVVACFYIAKH